MTHGTLHWLYAGALRACARFYVRRIGVNTCEKASGREGVFVHIKRLAVKRGRSYLQNIYKHHARSSNNEKVENTNTNRSLARAMIDRFVFIIIQFNLPARILFILI